MNRRIGCALLVVALGGWPAAAGADAAGPNLGAIAEKAFALGSTPGMAVAVVQNGRVVFQQGYGFANVEKATPVTADTRFAIGSLTKQFTAASVLMLAREHKLALDDALAKYLPAMPNAGSITLRELLWQTTGLHTYPVPKEHPWPFQGTIEPAQLFALLATDKPEFTPGTKWAYSNTNYAALAEVVAIASGMPYARFLQNRIFDPLGMSDTGYGYAAQKPVPPMATPYTGKPFAPFPFTLSLDLYYGAGGIVSTAHDMALWMQALLQGRVLDAPATSALWDAGHLRDGSAVDYAMGFVPATIDGHREVWHNGLAPTVGGYCYDAIFPADNVAIVVLTNGDQKVVEQMPPALVRQAFEAIITPPPAAPAAGGEDPAVTALVKKYYAQLSDGNVDTGALTPSFAAYFTPSFVAEVSAAVTAAGSVASWTFAGKFRETNGVMRYEYRLDFADGQAHTFLVWLAPDGKIAGSRMRR